MSFPDFSKLPDGLPKDLPKEIKDLFDQASPLLGGLLKNAGVNLPGTATEGEEPNPPRPRTPSNRPGRSNSRQAPQTAPQPKQSEKSIPIVTPIDLGGGSYAYDVPLAGVLPENITIEFEKDTNTIVVKNVRTFPNFSSEKFPIRLSKAVNAEDIKAEYTAGLVRIIITPTPVTPTPAVKINLDVKN